MKTRKQALRTSSNMVCRKNEVEEILPCPGEDRSGREGSRVALGKTKGGRYVRVIYVPDVDSDNAFVITAYEICGKPLTAYKRRLRKRGKR